MPKDAISATYYTNPAGADMCAFTVINEDTVISNLADAHISVDEATTSVMNLVREAYAAGLARGADLAVQSMAGAVDVRKIGAGVSRKAPAVNDYRKNDSK